MSPTLTRLVGLLGIGLFLTFVIGLTYSIATGFAGFWGGFPVMVIVTLVGAMAVYDYWDACFRKKPE